MQNEHTNKYSLDTLKAFSAGFRERINPNVLKYPVYVVNCLLLYAARMKLPITILQAIEEIVK